MEGKGGRKRESPRAASNEIGSPPPDNVTRNAADLVWNYFTGRRTELALLRASVDAALQGRPSVTLISGEPGIGKTRLVEEVANYARERGMSFLRGRCFDSHSTVSYFPFVEIFHQYVSIRSPKAVIEELGGDIESLARLLPELAAKTAQHRPASANHVEDRLKLLDSVSSFLAKTANNTPLTIALEDLHWADEGSLALLVHLVRRLETGPLLIVGTYRDTNAGDNDQFVRFLEKLKTGLPVRNIGLTSLSEGEVVELFEGIIQQRLDPDNRTLPIEIQRISGGNSLFIQQLIHELIEGGHLCLSGGRWAADFDLSEHLTEFAALRQVVELRLGGLNALARTLLGEAAVLGDEFELDVLTAMSDVPSAAICAALDDAVESGILVPGRGKGGTDYVFAHTLIRRQLYENHSVMRCRALHTRAARALESVKQASLTSYLGRLAYHCEKSGTPADLQRAFEYSMQAGEAAYNMYWFEEASSHWRSACEIAQRIGADKATTARVMDRLAEATLLTSTRPDQAAEHLQSALTLYEEAGMLEEAAGIHARLASILSIASSSIDVGRAKQHSVEAVGILDPNEPDQTSGESYISQSLVAHASFRTEEGLAASNEAMKIARELDESDMWCEAAALNALFLWARGEVQSAGRLHDEVAERSRRAHSPKALFAAAWAGGYCSLLLMDPKRAQSEFSMGLSAGSIAASPFARQILLANCGIAHALAGELPRARELLDATHHRFLEANVRFLEGDLAAAENILRQELDRARDSRSAQLEWAYTLWLARLHRARGEFEQAERLLRKALVLRDEVVRVPEEIWTRAELALLYAQSDRCDLAEVEVERCRELMTGDIEGWRGLAGSVEFATGVIRGAQGKAEESENFYERALDILVRYRLKRETAEVLTIWSRQLINRGDLSSAIEKLNQAEQIYTKLGAGGYWLEEAETVKRSLILQPLSRIESGDSETLSAKRATTKLTALYSLAADYSKTTGQRPQDEIYSYATIQDVALLGTFIHDAIAHLMSAISKASKLREPIDRLVVAVEGMSDSLEELLNRKRGKKRPGGRHRASQ